MSDIDKYSAIRVDGRVVLTTTDPGIVRAAQILIERYSKTGLPIEITHHTTTTVTKIFLEPGSKVDYKYSVTAYESVEPNVYMITASERHPEKQVIPIPDPGVVDKAILESHPDFQ